MVQYVFSFANVAHEDEIDTYRSYYVLSDINIVLILFV